MSHDDRFGKVGLSSRDVRGNPHSMDDVVRVPDMNFLAETMETRRVYVLHNYPSVKLYEIDWDKFKEWTIVRIHGYVKEGMIYVGKKPIGISTDDGACDVQREMPDEHI